MLTKLVIETMKTRLSLLVLTFTLCGLSACHDDKDPVPEPTPEKVELPEIPAWEEPDYATVKCNTPVYVSDGIRPEVKKGMEQFLTNISSMEDAQVIVLKPEDIGTYEGELLEAFNRGALIVLARPTGEHFQDINQHYHIFDAMPFDASQNILLFATDNSHVSYTLYADGPAEGEADEAYYKQRIFNFFRWLKQDRQNKVASTRTDDDGQYIIQNFEVQMSHDLLKGNGTKPQELKTSGSIDLSYYIRPVYVFEGSGAEAGDSYMVEAELTVHNEEFYRPYVTDDPINKYLLAGYFMEQLDMYAQLVGENGGDLTGVAINADAWQSQELKNLTLEQHQDAKGEILNHYQVENIDFEGTPASMDFLNDAIPQVARQNFNNRVSWTWQVPAQTNGVEDCATVNFSIRSILNLQYGSFYYKVLGNSEQADWGYGGIGSTVSITSPERRPQEVIDRENKMVHFSIPVVDEYVNAGDPLALTPSVLGDNLTSAWQVGDVFYVEYSDADRRHMKTTAEIVSIDPETQLADVVVELENPSEKALVAFYYPKTYLDECVEWGFEKSVRKSQIGTLDDFRENWDASLGFDYPKVINGQVTLPNGIVMEHERAIWKMTFSDGDRDITSDVTELEIVCDTGKGNAYTYTITPETSLDVFYVALNHADLASLTINAYTPAGVLTTSRPSVKLEAGMFYVSEDAVLAPPTDGGPVDLAYKRIYEAQDGDVLTGVAHSSAHITVAAGATITLQDVDITGMDDDTSNAWSGITCLGDATLILEGENAIAPAYQVWPAIYVPQGSTLTIRGDGKLTAISRGDSFVASHAAAIGGGNGIACGNIVIEGGIIEAIAHGEGGAGIGGGGGGSGANCGDITITGGKVTAVGSSRGAGIGNGLGSKSGDILITGGEVSATGGIGGAGIGAVFASTFGDITITGGIVKAVGGDHSPGIGYRGMGGTILISGGEVEAIGDGTAAAIGGSTSVADNPCIFEAITITDGVKRLVVVKGSDCPRYIGNGKTDYDSGPVILDGIEDPEPQDLFPHFESLLDDEVWTLLNHNR